MPQPDDFRAGLYALGHHRDLLAPSDVLDVVRGADVEPIEPDELAPLLDQVEQRVRNGADDDEIVAPGWQWTAALLVLVLREAIAGRGVPVVWSSMAIGRMVRSHAWHVGAFGNDANAEQRERYLDALVRIVRHSDPREWERALLEPAAGGPTPRPTVGERIRRQRTGLAMTQDQLAHALDVDRTTVVRWERDERVPSWPQRDALARVLGGEPSSYDRPPA